MSWDLPSPMRPLVEGTELFVGEWTCPGARQARTLEQAHYVELDLLRAGMHVRTLGRQRSVVDPTTAALQVPGDEYWMASTGEQPQRSTLLLLRGALAEELGPHVRAQVLQVSAEVARLHFKLLRDTDPLAREEVALALVHRFVRDAAPERTRAASVTPAWRQLTEELQHQVATRFAERLTLEALASEVHASPFHASRVFHAVTGETLHRHLTRVRLRAALFELEEASGRLTDVALGVGFSSHSHFTSAFRQEFGCTPSALARGRG
ncbi:helix-turn-helix transcriptional regulator [Myxococcus sp. CA051A]|uniref:helix-turn-helix transcriptional regulator n=1 Tax=Myxococcus sp. CA051A TaxID=2741739 RepID=UPI00157B936A|nr:helix-turn-helix domain-containing protein [Myxococcus sp. CA051A]NTX63842.1 helix-turn-helix transcriptional regulator [Myxococcus sp. CA051A]